MSYIELGLVEGASYAPAPTTGTFNLNFQTNGSGSAVSPSVAINYYVLGKLVVLSMGNYSFNTGGTTNGTYLQSTTAIPSFLFPTGSVFAFANGSVIINAVTKPSLIYVSPVGFINITNYDSLYPPNVVVSNYTSCAQIITYLLS